ncbi:MAG: helix-turn-helix transcriptional regulator [Mycoplasmatales bacterium]|nr:helix-turn-helix transcriptional regulator [Mycoplasmatales bacterium]
MEYFNYSNKDLSLLTKLSEKTIRNILNLKTTPDIETLRKLEQAFDMENGDLIILQQNIIKAEQVLIFDNWILELMNDVMGEYATVSIYERLRRIFKGKNSIEYKKMMEKKIIGAYKYKDDDLANLWIALAMKDIEGKEYTNKFYKIENNIFLVVMNIMFSDENFEEKK